MNEGAVKDISIIKTLIIGVGLMPLFLLCTSHSVFVPRQITFDSLYELALNNYDMYHHGWGCRDRGAVDMYAVPLFQQSVKPDAIAQYLLPNDATCLAIREDGLGNIGSLSLELTSTGGTYFSSDVSIKPQQQIGGALFNFHFNFCHFGNLWASVVFAVIHSRHTLKLCESNLMNPGTLPGLQDATEALNNPTWCFGKLSPCSLSSAGVDDIQFKLGYDWYLCNQQSHVGLYGVASVPTGRKDPNTYLFAPRVGSVHTSLGLGTNMDFDLVRGMKKKCAWLLDVKYRYVLSAKEIRSFDICPNGDWSRYLQVVHEDNPLFSTPGINFFTQMMHVTPGSALEVWTAFHFEWCSVNAEIGYNFWFRQAEKVCLACPLPAGVGILDIPGLCPLSPTTASTFNISQSIVPPNIGVSDPEFVPVTSQDINFKSAAHPNAFSNTVYAALGYSVCNTLVGLGASYECGHGKAALSNWALWANLGFSF